MVLNARQAMTIWVRMVLLIPTKRENGAAINRAGARAVSR